MGMEFEFGMMKKFWRQMVGMVAPQWECLMPLSWALTNAQSGKWDYVYFTINKST